EGDTPVFQFDTVDTFDSPNLIEVSNDVDPTEDANEELDFVLPNPLSDTMWHCRARVDRPGHEPGNWSGTVSKTINAASPNNLALDRARVTTGLAAGGLATISDVENLVQTVGANCLLIVDIAFNAPSSGVAITSVSNNGTPLVWTRQGSPH